MGRAERRRNAKKEKKERKTTYNLTKEQLNNMVHERVEDELVHMRQEAMEEAINTAMLLLLTLPLKVLMDHYWNKSYIFLLLPLRSFPFPAANDQHIHPKH